jgi:hypothetical protein
VVKNHVYKSAKHKSFREAYRLKHGDDQEVKEYLEDYFKEHPSEEGATLHPEIQLIRYRTVESCLAAGIPLEKVCATQPIST